MIVINRCRAAAAEMARLPCSMDDGEGGAMITRKIYRADLQEKENQEEWVQQSLATDKEAVKNMVGEQKCLTAALYRHENMLFLYYEALDGALLPQELFPALSGQLTPWAFMEPVFWHTVPGEKEDWARQGKKTRRGRIARLLPGKLDSYVSYHRAIVEEGLLDGDRYQFIALRGDMLFSYFEEPKIFTHIKSEVQEESEVIAQWLKADPESHFDHELSGKENFLLIEEVFSFGAEDLQGVL